MHHKLNVLGEYVGHLVVGAGMFAALLAFGIVLNVLVEWSEPLVADRTFLQLMKLVEKVILYSDATLTIWWAMYSTYKAIEALHDE